MSEGSLESIPLKTRIISQRNPVCSATIIFFHGSGNTADGLINLLKQAWGDDLSFPHIKMVFPTAPARPYTPLNGELSTVWFDRSMVSPTAAEDRSTDDMCKRLSYLINDEVKSGIPKNRIVIGGYSMGGAIAIPFAYKYHMDVAGVFALSSFLNHDSSVYEVLKQTSNCEDLPPLFQCQGGRDDIVPLEWAEDTHRNLTSVGVKVDFHNFDIEHELVKEEISLWRDWILERLPETT